MLNIFILETCPYCKKVIEFLNDNKIKYKKFDIINKDNLTRLIDIGGKEQVPFIYNDETNDKVYESEEIIKYLANYKQENNAK